MDMTGKVARTASMGHQLIRFDGRSFITGVGVGVATAFFLAILPFGNSRDFRVSTQPELWMMSSKLIILAFTMWKLFTAGWTHTNIDVDDDDDYDYTPYRSYPSILISLQEAFESYDISSPTTASYHKPAEHEIAPLPEFNEEIMDDDEEDTNEPSMEATWKAIMESRGKSETWEKYRRCVEEVSAETAPRPPRRELIMRKKPETSTRKKRKEETAWRGYQQLVVDRDELFNQADALIRRHYHNLGLQRKQSEENRRRRLLMHREPSLFLMDH